MNDNQKMKALVEGTCPDKIFKSMHEFADFAIDLGRKNKELSDHLKSEKALTKQKIELLKLDIGNALYEISKNHG